jgi:hypothetical protein
MKIDSVMAKVRSAIVILIEPVKLGCTNLPDSNNWFTVRYMPASFPAG